MKNLKNFTTTFKAYFAVSFLFLCLALSGCGDDNDLAENKEQKTIQILRVISEAVEENDGKIDFDKITVADDWDKFCLVMAYSVPRDKLKESINEPSSIDQFLPDNNDDGFGLGVLFVKDKVVIDSIHLPRYNLSVPASSDVGEFIKSISHLKSNGRLGLPFLSPKLGTSEAPKPTCYAREYTLKIHKDWEYTIVKDEK